MSYSKTARRRSGAQRHFVGLLSVLVVAAAVVIAAAAIIVEIELEQSTAVGAVNASVLKNAVVNADSLSAVGALYFVAIVIVAEAVVIVALVDISLEVGEILVDLVNLIADNVETLFETDTLMAISSSRSIMALMTLTSSFFASRSRPSTKTP